MRTPTPDGLLRGCCPACGARRLLNRLDLGPQPICNRFLEERAGPEYRHPLVLGQCGGCGLVQNLTPAPASQLRPRCGWISYREPEGHLDALAEAILRLPGVDAGAAICGLSGQDDSTLHRLRERGVRNTWRLDKESDLGITEPHAGIETIQERIAAADGIPSAHPPADVIIARYALEHAHDLAGFLVGLRRLAPQGHLVFEVPDCERAFLLADYSAIWEEHTLYFTLATLATLAVPGSAAVEATLYPHPFQDALVAVARPGAAAATPLVTAPDPDEQMALFGSFAQALPERRARLREHLAAVRQHEGNIALFGAGHAACSFVNILEVGDLIEFVADDDPHKAGRFMPGSRLPIRPSDALLDKGIGLCLLAVGDDAEDRVLAGNRQFTQAGGRFASIFPSSRFALTM